ncbi:PAS domain-containing protein, partial [Halorubrum sp. SP9]
MSDAPESGSVTGDDPESAVFEQLFEHTPDAVLVIDTEANRILRCNDQACELLGYDRDHLLSLGPPDIHPHDYDVFESFVKRVN